MQKKKARERERGADISSVTGGRNRREVWNFTGLNRLLLSNASLLVSHYSSHACDAGYHAGSLPHLVLMHHHFYYSPQGPPWHIPHLSSDSPEALQSCDADCSSKGDLISGSHDTRPRLLACCVSGALIMKLPFRLLTSPPTPVLPASCML